MVISSKLSWKGAQLIPASPFGVGLQVLTPSCFLEAAWSPPEDFTWTVGLKKEKEEEQGPLFNKFQVAIFTLFSLVASCISQIWLMP